MPVPVVKTPSGSWLVLDEPAPAGSAVAYCRVSDADHAELDRQILRVVRQANARGIAVVDTVGEIGSGLDSRRAGLHRILANPAITTIIVEHRDRLSRFGVEYLESALAATGRKLVVLDDDENTDDLIGDIATANGKEPPP